MNDGECNEQLSSPACAAGSRLHHPENRVLMGSMHTGLEELPDGPQRLAAFYAERAAAGVALIVTGGIAPNDKGVVYRGGSTLNSEAQLPHHRPVTEAVHRAGGKIALQILHAGRYSYQPHPVGPSALQAPINPFAPSALSEAEIEQTIADFARCAALAQQAGYDGVEVMGSEGYLINQFWRRAPTSATIAGAAASPTACASPSRSYGRYARR